MRGRKSQVSSTLVIMVAGLIGLLVLVLVTGGFSKVFKSITGKSDCQMQFLVSSFTKAGGAQTVEPECEPHLITVTQETLDKGKANANKILSEYQKNFDAGKYKNIDSAQQYWNGNFKGYNEPKKLNEWVMDKTVADEMKYCWDITGRGKLDLFNDWWMLIDCTSDKGQTYHSCTKDEIYGMYQLFGYGITSDKLALSALGLGYATLNYAPFKWKAAALGVAALPPLVSFVKGDTKLATPPTFCVLCSRIKFDESIKNSFQDQKISSMALWLANNPVTDTGAYSKVSYAQYLENDDFKGLWASKDSYIYDINQAYAILYSRINVLKSKDALNSIGNLIGVVNEKDLPQAVQMIKLVPYQNIKDSCTYLVG